MMRHAGMVQVIITLLFSVVLGAMAFADHLKKLPPEKRYLFTNFGLKGYPQRMAI
ncbi:hypothetical protein N8500_10790 [Candidatus Puniceispirillum sp.]|nr:hypothetical protein [Candidatus Puniceispirillum sp.]